MTIVALFGDSTYNTWYLNAAANSALVDYHGVSPAFDGRLHVKLADHLTMLGASATTSEYANDGMDSGEARSTAYKNPTWWADCLASAPDVVVINFGINDAAAGVTVEAFTANIQAMVDDAVAASIVPCLATTPYWDYPTHYSSDANTELDPYNAALISLAALNGCTLIDIRRECYSSIKHGIWDLYTHNDYTYMAGHATPPPGSTTNVHPYILGANLMAGCIARALVKHEPLLGGTAGLPDRSTGTALADLAIRSIPILKAV